MHIKLQELTSNAIRVIREKTAEKFGVVDGGAKFKQIMAEVAKIVHDESEPIHQHRYYRDVIDTLEPVISEDDKLGDAISDICFVLDRRHPEMRAIVKAECKGTDAILEFQTAQTEELYDQLIGLSE